MGYEVTAIRKRPLLFRDLRGQEFVVSTLSNSLQNGTLAHAYLFFGPHGVGKTSAARILATALNVPKDFKGPKADEWEEYPGSKEIARGISIDVIEIDGASNTSVNDVRLIKDQVLFPPLQLTYKVYIIDEVHMLSISAFNALLKTIEEPPPYVIFIFATTDIHRIPSTIRSRCQQFTFRLLPLSEITAALEEVCQELSVQAGEDALKWIARESWGSLRDAYTLFDQIASFSKNHITMDKIVRSLGLPSPQLIETLVVGVVKGKAAEGLTALHALLDAASSPEKILSEITEFFRGLLFAQLGVKQDTHIHSLPSGITQVLETPQIEHALRLLLECGRVIRRSSYPQLEIELLVGELSLIKDYIPVSQMVRKLREIVSLNATASVPSRREVGKKKQLAPAEIHAILKHIQDPPLLVKTLEKADWGIGKEGLHMVVQDKYARKVVENHLPAVSDAVKQAIGEFPIHLEATETEELPEHVQAAKSLLGGRIIESEEQI